MATVLLVEDDPSLRESIAELLTDAGFTVLSCANGRDAMAHLPALRPPCCVILDLMMPVADGWAVLREIRALPVRVPVLVSSVHADADKADAEAVLRPPYGADVLLSRVRALLRLEAAG